MDDVSDYYNMEAFKESHPLQRIEKDMIVAEVQNFFFLLRRGFVYAFSPVLSGN